MKRHELIGWILFTASACFFLASGIRSGDVPSLIGSALFLVACFFFMAPIGRPQKKERPRLGC
ncbi:MAG: hypothetical protein ACR2O4_06795 [Hyphomicrobiaceae bacterium]